jgi:hypothetical protein
MCKGVPKIKRTLIFSLCQHYLHCLWHVRASLTVIHIWDVETVSFGPFAGGSAPMGAHFGPRMIFVCGNFT